MKSREIEVAVTMQHSKATCFSLFQHSFFNTLGWYQKGHLCRGI